MCKLNQLVQGYPVRILGDMSSLENYITHELDNTAMWQHGDTSGKTSRISRTTEKSHSSRGNLIHKVNDIIAELWHKPNSLIEDVCLNKGLGNTVKSCLVMELTNLAKNDSNVLRVSK